MPYRIHSQYMCELVCVLCFKVIVYPIKPHLKDFHTNALTNNVRHITDQLNHIAWAKRIINIIAECACCLLWRREKNIRPASTSTSASIVQQQIVSEPSMKSTTLQYCMRFLGHRSWNMTLSNVCACWCIRDKTIFVFDKCTRSNYWVI